MPQAWRILLKRPNDERLTKYWKNLTGHYCYSVYDKDLEELLSNYWLVKEVKIIGDKGFGFVEMSSQSEAEKAKEALDGSQFKGRTLKIDEARPQKKTRTQRL